MNLSGIKILVAEDEAINRLYIKIVLNKTGMTVLEARDGLEVLEQYKQNNPRLILLDISMPHMSGLEAAREIRELEEGTGKHVPIIALTAHTMPKKIEEFLAAGIDAVTEKPVDDATLLKAIQKALAEYP